MRPKPGNGFVSLHGDAEPRLGPESDREGRRQSPDHASSIFFSSRSDFLRKSLTAALSPALEGFIPNWR